MQDDDMNLSVGGLELETLRRSVPVECSDIFSAVTDEQVRRVVGGKWQWLSWISES